MTSAAPSSVSLSAVSALSFRPCIDVRKGKVTQIVGSTLTDRTPTHVNFECELPSAHFAQLYARHGLRGGHVIMLDAEPETLSAAYAALRAYPGGLQVGGGVTLANARAFLDAGASHVIVTSFVFRDGKLDMERLREMSATVGREKLVIDLSCRKRSATETDYFVVTDKWQKFTDLRINESTMHALRAFCDEYLVHGVDVEGKRQGVDLELIKILAAASPIPVTYAGGVRSLRDCETVADMVRSGVKPQAPMHLSIGSALDIFGGDLSFESVVEWFRTFGTSLTRVLSSVAKPPATSSAVLSSSSQLSPCVNEGQVLFPTVHLPSSPEGAPTSAELEAFCALGAQSAILGSFTLCNPCSAADSQKQLMSAIIRRLPGGCCRLQTSFGTYEDALAWLNKGVQTLIMPLLEDDIAQTFPWISELPRSRLAVRINARRSQSDESQWDWEGLEISIRRMSNVVSEIILDLQEQVLDFGASTLTKIGILRKVVGPEIRVTVANWSNPCTHHVIDLDRLGVCSQVASEHLIGRDMAEGAPLSFGSVIRGLLKTDRPDGLFPTVVVDEQGIALGLVYSSHKSIEAALAKRAGIYHSRSRGLWHKGSTSGASQDLLRVELDCDRDALRFIVHQHGAGFCHLNRRSCWSADSGLGGLQRVLESRVRDPSADPKSYTVQLLQNPSMLHAKILEEAQELVDAQDPDHITAEAADVIYFAMVKLAAHRISLDRVEAELDRRSLRVTRRKGAAKAPFLAAVQRSELQQASPSKSLSTDRIVSLLDYGAGNVRSLHNALCKLGYGVQVVNTADEILNARVLLFPGVGAFGNAASALDKRGWRDALVKYLRADRPYFGICLGMQLLFEASEESPDVKGLGVFNGHVERFRVPAPNSVPHMGWNGLRRTSRADPTLCSGTDWAYFVHSYRVLLSEQTKQYALTVTDYGGEEFLSAVQLGNVVATQFHPEKSSAAGLRLLSRFLDLHFSGPSANSAHTPAPLIGERTQLAKRIIACLDVRADDAGKVVVTKGDQYNVREQKLDSAGSPTPGVLGDATIKGAVRNLGDPAVLATSYFEQGADEITLLNITGFRLSPLTDAPMIKVLENASETVFVPITIGGGIRDYTDSNGRRWSALDAADLYFRAGADKVSIGSDAVTAAEAYLARGKQLQGDTAIEQISRVYGRQAVVISIDPKRVWVNSPADTRHHTVCMRRNELDAYCWYQCTVKGGRETRDIDAFELAQAVEAMGAGELLVNCIDTDGQQQGFDCDLMRDLKSAVSIPVVASSGAGTAQHFADVFALSGCDAALAAGIFHRNQVTIAQVKKAVAEAGFAVRPV